MKSTILLTILIFLGVFAEARTMYVIGRGQATGYCSYFMGSTCVDQVKAAAERDGNRDAQWSCTSRQGRPAGYRALCNTSCFPNFLTPGDRNTPVRCNSSCSLQCEVPN